ncbi:hypothetical protein EPUS_07597 [Endocarpon pusillum Z07020]|uniref:FAD-binding domain-containing protein n=1 Tax=Endocarpon pusillum (strain Z07020 / HMAS-L-300199) TaxID=1263415 RepID=U1FZG7_ENDPU|nr:uncharacterized protein EPUS_07597 [Endocarpon pusillum Z07020]ERF70332.1 hypothetical protein EPUS_07597 [Endocarpon pusillum Z07020]
MATSHQDDTFKVVIVGGGIAGLTLANALQHAGVDYVLLEAKSEIAPSLGASIGIAPNGIRILDQLSCYDAIEGLITPVETVGLHDVNGKELAPRSDMFKLARVRMNYPVCFLDRQALLKILAEHVCDQSRICLSKRVATIEHFVDHVEVCCTDGTSYNGAVVVGADGVNSTVRREMWRAAEALESGLTSKEDRATLFAEYKCLYGISSPTAGLAIGNFEVTFAQDVSTMVISSKGGRVFWFLFGRLPKVCRAGEIPRFSRSEAEQFARENLDILITPTGVKFGHIWKNRENCTLVPIEEGDYAHWTWGRFACVGDSIHKMTPNSGAGGNAAIESAAALANAINSLKIAACNPSLEDVSHIMTGYQEERKFRVSETIKSAHQVTRFQALKGVKERLIAKYVLPVTVELGADSETDGWIGSTMLNYLPPPPRSLCGTMPFNPSQGRGKHESLLRRAIFALPLLAVGIWCFVVILKHLPFGLFTEILESGRISWDHDRSVSVIKTLFHIEFLDQMLRSAALAMVPSALAMDKPSALQMLTFITDTGLVYAIMLVEGARRANLFKPASLPFIFGLLAVNGIGVFFPLYYYLFYVLSPIATFAALDKRLTDRAFTLGVLPVLALSYYTPLFVAYCASSLELRYRALWMWHLFPVWTVVGQHVLAWTVMPKTIVTDRMQNPKRDLWAIRITIGSLTALSAAVWLSTLYQALRFGFSLSALFFPNDDIHTYLGGVRNMLVWDQLCFSLSSLLWMLYLFSDLKRAGMVRRSWSFVLGVLIGASVFGGTGAAVGVAWLWREEVLASRRHKDAVVKAKGS